MECSLPDSSIYGILQARMLELGVMPSSRASSWPRDQTQVSYAAGRFFTIWATRESHSLTSPTKMSIFHEMLLNRSNSFIGWKRLWQPELSNPSDGQVMGKNLTTSSNIRQMKCPPHTGQRVAPAELCLMALPLSDGTGCFLQVDVSSTAVLLQIRTCPVICWGPEALRGRTRKWILLGSKTKCALRKTKALGEPISPRVPSADSSLFSHLHAHCLPCPCVTRNPMSTTFSFSQLNTAEPRVRWVIGGQETNRSVYFQVLSTLIFPFCF